MMNSVESKRTHTVTWGDPAETRVKAASVSGAEYLKMVRDSKIPKAPFAALLDFELTEVGNGWATYRVAPQEFHYNNAAIAHGGMAAALLDCAFGAAIVSTLPPNLTFTTLTLLVNYVRPITNGRGTLTARASVAHKGRTIGTGEGRITDESNRLYAHGTTTWLIFERRNDGRQKGRP